MKEYSGGIMAVAMIIAGFSGFFTWIGYLAEALNYGNTLSFVIMLVFGEFLIPFYSIIPFLVWFAVLFVLGLPIYGLYKLFK